jgi:tRNA modification GTPase
VIVVTTTVLERIDEIVVAASSAPGAGAMGIVRLSGAGVIELVERMALTPKPLSDLPAWTRIAGEVGIADELTVPAFFHVFRAPHSYTRQDLIEIYTVGSPPVLSLVQQRAIELGALLAEAGEFTARAFLNGAMDLAQAEAVAGVIRAEGDTQLRAARRMMDGTLAGRITEIREAVAELVGLVEADIDFAEEPIEFITPGTLREKLGAIARVFEELLAGSTAMERLEGLPHILLLGPPNAGKSSLMNALSGTDRAICAAAAGTTRDILSAPVRLGRGEAILLDSAGVDRSEDEIIAQARALTFSRAQRVDLICLVVDLTRSDNEHFRESLATLDVPCSVIAANKCDLLPEDAQRRVAESFRAWNLGEVCIVSALTGTGLNELRALLAEKVNINSSTVGEESIVISQRQVTAISQAAEAIQRAIRLSEQATETIDCADLLAFELREALTALGAVTGEVTTEHLLADIFSKFCIGK